MIRFENVSKVYNLTPQFELRRLLVQFASEAKRRKSASGRGIRSALQNVNLEVEDGESIVRRVVEVKNLYRVLKGMLYSLEVPQSPLSQVSISFQ